LGLLAPLLLAAGPPSPVRPPAHRPPDDFELFLEGIFPAPRGPRQVVPGSPYVPALRGGPTGCSSPLCPKEERGPRQQPAPPAGPVELRVTIYRGDPLEGASTGGARKLLHRTVSLRGDKPFEVRHGSEQEAVPPLAPRGKGAAARTEFVGTVVRGVGGRQAGGTVRVELELSHSERQETETDLRLDTTLRRKFAVLRRGEALRLWLAKRQAGPSLWVEVSLP
jgi:hypothetical protein